MSNMLLSIGMAVLLILPFIGLDKQSDKMNLVLIISVALCLKALFDGTLRIKEKSLLALIAFLPLSIKYGLEVQYAPYLTIALIVGLYASISHATAKKSLNVVLWCVSMAASYGILQCAGFESIFIENVVNPGYSGTPSAKVASVLGNPIYLGAFVAMFVPLAICMRKWWMVAVMAICVLVTKSDMAIGSMICSVIAIPFLKNKKTMLVGSVIAVALLTVIGFNFKQIRPQIHDSARFSEWTRMLKYTDKGITIKSDSLNETIQKKYNLFGFGGGSFKKMYPGKISTEQYDKAHNEYIQCYWEFGIITAVLFLFFLSTSIVCGHNAYTRAAVLCICLNAIGLFVWQLGPTLFASIFVLCLNKGL